MSHFNDRIFSAPSIMSHRLWVNSRTVYFPHFYKIWLIDYESTRGPYIFRVLDASCQGPYILADRIFFVKGPYIFSQRTVYFQNLRTVYFRGPYILRQRTVYFSQKDRIFSVLGPYIFSQDRIFYCHIFYWPVMTHSNAFNWLVIEWSTADWLIQ